MGSERSGKCNVILVKTPIGMENIVASLIEDLDKNAKIEIAPRNFKGLVLVEPSLDVRLVAEDIEKNVPEAEKVVVVERCVDARLEDMARAAADVARSLISRDETFAVRTVRRGSHNFTSIDVNVVVGDAVRKATGASVNLDYPDKIVAVEIIADKAYIAVYPGSREWRKRKPGKYPLYKIFSKISIIQMPYLGPLDACRTMGTRIGREVQNFEVRELVIAPIGAVDAVQLNAFIAGVLEGIESRYAIQSRTYARKPRRVQVFVQDLYQLVRSRRGEPIIVFEPEGEYVSRAADKLLEIIMGSKRVNMLFGSREGIPKGVYRFADLVLDIAPGITLSTEYAAAAGLIAVATVVHDKLHKRDKEGL